MVNITNVQASVVDIRLDKPQNTDKFLLDSNILIWQTYSRAFFSFNNPNSYQITLYPNYIKDALNASSTLLNCSLSFSEISHVIEKIEFEFYNSQVGSNNIIGSIKEFRHNYPNLRASVVREILNDWNVQIQGISQQISIDITSQVMNNTMNKMSSVEVDGYDYFMVEAMQQHNITQIITDDADYITVPNITVFTANNTAIRAARNQNKYLVR